MGGNTQRCTPTSIWTEGSTVSQYDSTIHKVKIISSNLLPAVSALPIASTFKLNSSTISYFYNYHKAMLLSTLILPTKLPIHVVVPTSATMESTSTALLLIRILPLIAKQAHGFLYLASSSLLSIGQLHDHQCTAIFTADTAAVYHNRNLTVTPTGPPLLTGKRDTRDKL